MWNHCCGLAPAESESNLDEVAMVLREFRLSDGEQGFHSSGLFLQGQISHRGGLVTVDPSVLRLKRPVAGRLIPECEGRVWPLCSAYFAILLASVV